MSLNLPIKEWWTAKEIADAGLPDMPQTQQGTDSLAKKQDWRGHPQFARRREGRGGGWEYHWRLFPARAQRVLIERANPPEAPKPRQDREEVWAWFDALPESVKDKAKRSLRIVQEVEALAPAVTKFVAVGMIARQHHIADRTVWNWFERVEGVDPADRLPYLAPRHRASLPKGQKVEAAPEFYAFLKVNFLRLEGPGFSQCWRDAKALCEANGQPWLEEQTARRWLNKTVSRIEQVFAREGMKGLRQVFPPQIRDRSTMSAMDMVNADCHKIDVFVWWPGYAKPIRPQLIVFQDIYSGKILSWAIDTDPNKVAVMQSFMKMLKDFGIPGHCLFDNGMEFANKDMTGGAKHRFRFKISDDEPVGILGMLGIGMSFATPAHGQAKPIERAFGDFANDIAKDPRFAGAYTGRRVDAKPENYMSKAIELETFIAVVEERIAEHNARDGRRSHTAQGRSLDETFAESYARTPIRPATEEQLRLCLMAQYVRPLNKKNGQITLYKNFYWSEWMSEIAGRKVTARFNPEDLHEGAYIYSMAGEYLGYAECRQKSEFRDLASAKAAAKEWARRRKQYQSMLKEQRPISISDLAAALDARPKAAPVAPEAKVVKLDRLAQIELRKKGGGLVQPALPVPDTSRDAELAVLQFPAPAAAPKRDPDVERFWRMIEIEARMTAGEDIPAADAEFWGRIKDHPVYLAQREVYDRFGAVAIG
ncbi:transposase [Gemmobacter nanjingensis]|uniref:Transposase n=1 Tax=Gemmobacter nanjingensis TaxID=488454 RepID=A0ABQ3FGH7_9RHOB|nr:transposase domain-containing protein [Gemmobacter nanjingensis]GHC22494.1 transposase [Gemmobacter nanjingensis]